MSFPNLFGPEPEEIRRTKNAQSRREVIINELERLRARLKSGEARDLHSELLHLTVLVLAMAKGDKPCEL